MTTMTVRGKIFEVIRLLNQESILRTMTNLKKGPLSVPMGKGRTKKNARNTLHARKAGTITTVDSLMTTAMARITPKDPTVISNEVENRLGATAVKVTITHKSERVIPVGANLLLHVPHHHHDPKGLICCHFF
jgi:hypothetical protein